MPVAIVVAALVVAGAIVYPAPASGDLWTVATLLATIAFALALLPRGDR